MTTLNKTEIFKFAHKLTKEILSQTEGDYQATFGECLKEIYISIQKYTEMVLFQIQHQKENHGHIFTKSEQAYMEEKRANKFYTTNAIKHTKLFENLKHIKAELEATQKGAHAYYKRSKRGVTMC